MNLSTVSKKENQIILTLIKMLFLIVLAFSYVEVNAGRGCCSHHKGVNDTKCTTDGREVCNEYIDGKPVISNGDSCTCDPNNYDDSNLITPDGNYETHPYDYYQNYSSNNSENTTVGEESDTKKGWSPLEIIVFIIGMTPMGIAIIADIYPRLESVCKSIFNVRKK